MSIELISKLFFLYLAFSNIVVLTAISVYADDNGAYNTSTWIKLKVSFMVLLFGTFICIGSVLWDLYKKINSNLQYN
jgi:hypothetical protein